MADLNTLQQEVDNLILPFLETHGVELVELHLSGNYRRRMLRLYIDRPGGVTIGQCAKLSRELADILDTHDPIQGTYVLEVSSPGLDRALKTDRDFERSVGKLLKLEVNGQGTRVGTLKTVRLDHLDLEVEGDVIRVDRADINKANLHFEF